MKSMVYETPITSDIDLIAKIGEATARVHDTTTHFERVRESMRQCCDACTALNGFWTFSVNGSNFEHLL